MQIKKFVQFGLIENVQNVTTWTGGGGGKGRGGEDDSKLFEEIESSNC